MIVSSLVSRRTGFAAIDAIAPLDEALQDEIETRANAIDALYEPAVRWIELMMDALMTCKRLLM